MEEYSSNSIKARRENAAEKKDVQKIVTGKVVKKKQTGVRKLADAFLPEDIGNLKEYAIKDVIIPKVKDGVMDVVWRMLYGESAPKGPRSNPASRVQYGNYYRPGNNVRASSSANTRSKNFMDITIDNRGEAEAVLDRMNEMLEQYGMVSIADFYELVGESCEYTDNNYGWFDLRSASIFRVPEGYLIKLPKAVVLK